VLGEEMVGEQDRRLVEVDPFQRKRDLLGGRAASTRARLCGSGRRPNDEDSNFVKLVKRD
jgi:hypothetical protein